ncbi:MAG: DUF4214 domain-containing protein, partial [Desulfuromonadales bacterium]|nr:DUF4214 domain-containing protein [Desulfuromonadales bacterium]
NVTVTFTPTSVTSYSGAITVNSDKTSGTNTILISGFGLEQDNDSDGDGVVDSLDQCLETPLGTQVDSVGCPLPQGSPWPDEITIKLDVNFAAPNWGTYPMVRFYPNEPVDILDQINNPYTLMIFNAYMSGHPNEIGVFDKGGINRYYSPPIQAGTWYTVTIQHNTATQTADILVQKPGATGLETFYSRTGATFVIDPFKYFGVGYYDQPDDGSDWSPIRLDNVSITSSDNRVLYQNDFQADPGFTSYSATYAYWDQAAGNYFVNTQDNLAEKYWAHTPELNWPISEPGLVAYYRFDGSVLDSCVNAHHGTAFGMPVYAEGIVGQAIDLDGVDDYVLVYDQGEMVAQNTMSLAAWIKPRQVSNGGTPYNLYAQSELVNGYITHDIRLLGGKLDYDNWRPWDGFTRTVSDITPSEWVHVAIVRDDGAVSIYLDGELDATGVGEEPLDRNSIAKTLVGARWVGSQPTYNFDGLVDELRIYDRALSAGEVQSLYLLSNMQDADSDTIPDGVDNCPAIANPTQSDANSNGIGDACDSGDTDGDGLTDQAEWAYGTSVANPDSDGDGWLDGADTQPLLFQSPMSDNAAFVRQVYLDFLNREPDAGGLAYWTGELNAGRLSRVAMVEQYLLSPEFGETAASVERLYFAYFLRIPDYGGLMYWVNEYASGRRTLNNISDFFASSPEFQASYGSLSNSEFMVLVYQNVLGRDPEPAGYAFWVNELNAGNRTRGQVMVGFSESAEYQALMANPVYVTMTYVGLLGRSPDYDGFNYWVNRMDQGDSGQVLIELFLNSMEYAARFQ